MAVEDTILGLTDETERKRRQQEEAQRQQDEIAAAGGGPVVTPSLAATTGANPDQAKMFGTPAQTDGALEDALAQQEMVKDNQDDQLGTVLQERTFEDSVNNAKVQKAREFTDTMKEFGSLGGRVEKLVLEQFKQKTETDADGNVTPLSTVKGFAANPEMVGTLVGPSGDTESVSKVLTDFSDAVASGNMTQSPGLDAEGNPLPSAFEILERASADGIIKAGEGDTGLFMMIEQIFGADDASKQEMISTAISEGIIDPGEVTLGVLADSSLNIGLTEEQMVDSLGPDWRNMTPEQVDTKLQEQEATKGSRVAQLQQQLADPNLSAAARSDIMQELREAGASGESIAETEGAAAIDQAGTAGTIEINGEVRSISDILSDETLTAGIEAYLTDPESEASIKWAEENEDLVNWIKNEKEQVDKNSDELLSAADTLKAIQEHNENLRTTAIGGQTLSDETLEALEMGAGIKAKEFAQSPLYEELKASGSGDAVVQLNKILSPEFLDKSTKEYVTKMLKGDKKDIRKLITALKDPMFSKVMQLDEEWKHFDKSSSANDYVNLLFGKSISPAGVSGMKKRLKSVIAHSKMTGKPKASDVSFMEKLLTADNDQEIKKLIAGQMEGKSVDIEDALDDGNVFNRILDNAQNYATGEGIDGAKERAYQTITSGGQMPAYEPGKGVESIKAALWVNRGSTDQKQRKDAQKAASEYVGKFFDEKLGKLPVIMDNKQINDSIKKLTKARAELGEGSRGDNTFLDRLLKEKIEAIRAKKLTLDKDKIAKDTKFDFDFGLEDLGGGFSMGTGGGKK